MNKKPRLFLAFLCMACPLSVGSADALSSDRVGEVLAVKRQVYLERGGDTRPAQPDMALAVQDAVATAARSRAKLYFQDDSVLNLSELSRVQVAEYLQTAESERSRSIYRLLDGSLGVVVGRSELEVHTVTAVAAARGTHFVVTVEECDAASGQRPGPTCHQSCLFVLDGTVEVRNIDPRVAGATTVQQGEMSCVAPMEPPDPATPMGAARERKSRQSTSVIGLAAEQRLALPVPDDAVNAGETVTVKNPGGDIVTTAAGSAHWVIASAPAGSTAVVSDSAATSPTFVADLAGDYVLQLISDDGSGERVLRTQVITSRPLVDTQELAVAPSPYPMLVAPDVLTNEIADLNVPVVSQEPIEATTPVVLRVVLP